ncbi:rhodanese-like domain-containing protein [Microbacterium sp. DT81.1]|uniref:rhodanese-like domain-containing protein n=1 Tax=Microbacterium sp. DT81.1 TaxID=3393413 RepID=UPI003CF7C793
MTSTLPYVDPSERGPASPTTGPTTQPAESTRAAEAAEFFRRRLRFETDASDVYAAQRAGEEFVLLDSRSAEAWAQGHAAGAIHMPTREIADRAPGELRAGVPVVVYCWSPGCNGGVKAALELSLLGFEAKEMIGGFEYWAREGYPVEDGSGIHRRAVDPLTGTLSGSAASCAC